jgi:hypothetical protein
MCAESMEQKMAAMEKKVAVLEREVGRAQAVGQIQNLINRMQYYHSINKDKLIYEKIFAHKAPDIRLHFGEQGYWEGEGVKMVSTMEMGPSPAGEDARKGQMIMHLMLQPVIEIAGDGKTAQATFWAAGIMAMRDRKTGGAGCSWEWNRYGDDFIKEDGEWKLWHHHVYPLFRIGYDDKWADQFKPKAGMPEGAGMKFPAELDKYHHPPTKADVFYSPDEVLPEIPPPEPYETWNDKQSYSYV